MQGKHNGLIQILKDHSQFHVPAFSQDIFAAFKSKTYNCKCRALAMDAGGSVTELGT